MKQLTPRWILLGTITAITIYVSWLMVQPFISVLLWSLVLAVIASPVYKRVSRYISSPSLSALITLIIAILLIILPIIFIVQAVVYRSDDAVQAFMAAVDQLTDPEAAHIVWLRDYGIDVEAYISPDNIRDQARAAGQFLVRYSAGILGYTLITIIQLLLILFTTFYMLRDGGKLLIAIRGILPLAPQQADAIFQSVTTIISASLRGTMLIAIIQGALGGLAFWALGIPAAVFWAVVMFILSIIPLVGSGLIWVPAAIYLAMSDSLFKGIILIVWGAGVIATVDNILRPILVGSKTRMHELTVFFSVLGGMSVFGPVGIVVGPIVVAVAVGLLKIFQESANSDQSQSDSPKTEPNIQAEAVSPAIPVKSESADDATTVPMQPDKPTDK